MSEVLTGIVNENDPDVLVCTMVERIDMGGGIKHVWQDAARGYVVRTVYYHLGGCLYTGVIHIYERATGRKETIESTMGSHAVKGDKDTYLTSLVRKFFPK